MEILMNTLRYGITGVVAAVGTQMIADKAAGTVLGLANLPKGGSSLGADGAALFQTVVQLSFAAGGVLAGEYFLNQINAGIDDPIYRWIFYQTSFYMSTSAKGAAHNIRGLFANLFRMFDKKTPRNPTDPKMGPVGTGPVISQGPSNPHMGPVHTGPVIGSGPVHTGPVIGSGPVSTGPYISSGPSSLEHPPKSHGPVSRGPFTSGGKLANMVNIGSVGDQIIPDSVSHGTSSGCGSCGSN